VRAVTKKEMSAYFAKLGRKVVGPHVLHSHQSSAVPLPQSELGSLVEEEGQLGKIGVAI
jgi:hypothetical protein